MIFTSSHRRIAVVTMLYIGIAMVWLVLPDELLANASERSALQLAKNLLFILFSGAALLLLLRHFSSRRFAMDDLPAASGAAQSFPPWTHYGFALAITVATLFLRAHVHQPFVQRPLLIMFVIPIILSASLGGLWPGLLATAVVALATQFYFIPPLYHFHINTSVDFLQWGLLLINGLVISGLSETLHHGRRRLHAALGAQQSVAAALRDSEARYAAVIDAAMDGIITIDGERRILLFNGAAERIFGQSGIAVVGLPLDSLIPSRFHPPQCNPFLALTGEIDTESVQGMMRTVIGLRANGEEFPLEVSISRRMQAGQAWYTVLVRDISDRHNGQLALARHMQQLESQQEMSLAILAAHRPQDVTTIGLRHLRRQVPYWLATTMVFDWVADEAVVLTGELNPGSPFDEGSRVPLINFGLDDIETLKQGRFCHITDLGQCNPRPSRLDKLYQQGLRSYLRIPLMAEGSLLGVLNLGSATLGGFSDEQQLVALGYARQMAIVLQQSLLRQRVERLNHLYAVQSGINALLVRCHDRDTLFEGACSIAVNAGAFKMAWIGVLDTETLTGRVVASQGCEPGHIEKIRITARPGAPHSDRPACVALITGEIVICNDVTTDASLAALWPELLARGIRSAACLPIVVAHQALAVLVLFAEDVGAFDNEEKTLLQELCNDISFGLDHIQKEEQLNYLAYYDPLTGLANRSLVDERLALQISAASREQRKFAVVFIDIEHFKSINDVFGRAAGDDILKHVATRLEQHVSDRALLGRVNADQFVATLLDVQQEDDAARLVETLMHEYLGPEVHIGDTDLRLAAKFGIAMFPEDGQDATTLLVNAESALKKAKATGDRFLFYRQEMTARAMATLELENQLRRALELDQFILYYQPKISAKTRQICGVEALLRWQSPQLGLVAPAQFIPLLEETGLILEVGAWVLRRAVQDYQHWLDLGKQAPRIAVNVSPLQLRRADFLGTVRAALAMTGGGIDLEITESVIMEDIDGNIDKLQQVRQLDLAIAIDDFGTGYSSLAYLAKLPVQALKIDRSFVATMLEQADAMTLVAAIISLAHSLRLEVVAEGVETEAQALALTAMDCDVLQGYWFGRPVPFAELTQLLE